MTSKLLPFGRPLGTKITENTVGKDSKKTLKKNAKHLPTCPQMASKMVTGFAVRTLFFHSWPPWGVQLAPNASQRASQGAF